VKRKIFTMLLALSTALTSPGLLDGTSIANAETKAQPVFQPGVAEFIQGNYLGHASELPDANESLEVLKEYMRLKGSPMELEGFQSLSKTFPESRHARVGLAMAYYNEFKATGDKKFAELALQEELAAANIGLKNDKVLYVSLIKQMALDAGQPEAAEKWMKHVLSKNPDDYETLVNYSQLLKATKHADKAEKHLQHAINVRPAGNIDAHVEYAELLLDAGRYEEALLNTILIGESAYYLDFLHGYALEKLGRGEEAKEFYARAEDYSANFPFPERFMIQDSALQTNLSFEGMASIEVANPATTNLSWVTTCEAGGETIGAMRQVAWSVRQRVNRGSTYVNGSTCLYTTNSGATMNDKYANVICQSSQYSGVKCDSAKNVYSCTNANARTSTSNTVAYDVYNGLVPDPYTLYCPTGTPTSTSKCTAACSGATSNTTSFKATTPHSFLAYAHGPLWGCAINAGAVCGNGGSDNYFDYNN